MAAAPLTRVLNVRLKEWFCCCAGPLRWSAGASVTQRQPTVTGRPHLCKRLAAICWLPMTQASWGKKKKNLFGKYCGLQQSRLAPLWPSCFVFQGLQLLCLAPSGALVLQWGIDKPLPELAWLHSSMFFGLLLVPKYPFISFAMTHLGAFGQFQGLFSASL